MSTPIRARSVIRRLVGRPVASRQVQASLPLVLERYQVLFDSVSLPAMPAPVIFVHTAGKPVAYRSTTRQIPGRSIPGFVTIVPRSVPAQVSLRGVGEGTLVYFADEGRVPAWLSVGVGREPLTFTNEVIVALARQLMEAGIEKPRYLRALGNALIAELQHTLEQQPAPSRPPATRGGLRVAHTAIRHAHRHLGEALTVGDLASACGLGVTRFTQSFRETTGLTPHRFLRRARIERADELLRTTALLIGEIAEAVGFRGQSHFCTAFAQERGLTPSAYRRACRNVSRA